MSKRASSPYIITIFILLITAIYAYLPRFKKEEVVPIIAEKFPERINEWIYKEEGKLYEYIKETCYPKYIIDKIYRNHKGEEVELLIGVFVNNYKNNKIHTPKYIFKGFDLMDKGVIELKIKKFKVNINKVTLKKKETGLAFLYYYQVNKRLVFSDFYQKAYSVLTSLLYTQNKASFIIISSGFTDLNALNKARPDNLNPSLFFARYSLPIVENFLE